MDTNRWTLLLIIGLLLLASCSQPSDPLEHATSQTKPSTGKAAMVGQVISIPNGKPLTGTYVRLAQVHWNEDKSDGAYVVDGAASPGADLDENGIFTFTDLEPNDYVIVVGEIIGYHEVITESSGRARIYTAEAGSLIEVGVLNVDLPKQ